MTIAVCGTCHVPVDLCPYEGRHPESPVQVAAGQIADALAELDRHADDFVRWPWRDLDAVYGGMAPGTVHYVVGFSGLGKSTFISSAILRWAEAGRALDVMPLEIQPKTFRTYLACQTLGVDPGYLLSGDYLRQDGAAELRERVKAAVMGQAHQPFVRRVHVHGVPEVTVAALTAVAESAARRGAEILVIDHIDHIEGDKQRRRSLYETSVEVNKAVLRLAQDTGLVIVAMSQANQSALHGTTDRLAKYQPPQDNHVLNGGEKRRNATGMLGLYRPLLPPPEGADDDTYEAWKDTIRKARAGDAEPHTALEPNTVGVALMKSRNYGGREGARVSLAWQAGRVVERTVLPYSLRRVDSEAA